MRSNTTGSFNTANGYVSLGSNTTGARNTGTGYQAGYGTTTGNDNTSIGWETGNVITTGSQNVTIGSGSDPGAVDASNQIVIGYGATGLGDNYAVIGNSSIDRLYAAQDGAAVLYANSTIVASDRRVKKDIQDLGYGLDYINSLRPVSYYKKDPKDYPQELRDKFYPDGKVRELSDDQKRLRVGFIAQDVKRVNDEMGLENNVVSVDEDGFHRMDYEKIVVPLVKAVQEQQAQIKTLQKKYDQVALENQELLRLVSAQQTEKNDDHEGQLIHSDDTDTETEAGTDPVITSMR